MDMGETADDVKKDIEKKKQELKPAILDTTMSGDLDYHQCCAGSSVKAFNGPGSSCCHCACNKAQRPDFRNFWPIDECRYDAPEP